MLLNTRTNVSCARSSTCSRLRTMRYTSEDTERWWRPSISRYAFSLPFWASLTRSWSVSDVAFNSDLPRARFPTLGRTVRATAAAGFIRAGRGLLAGVAGGSFPGLILHAEADLRYADPVRP